MTESQQRFLDWLKSVLARSPDGKVLKSCVRDCAVRRAPYDALLKHGILREEEGTIGASKVTWVSLA
jgi:hypothetical protein